MNGYELPQGPEITAVAPDEIYVDGDSSIDLLEKLSKKICRLSADKKNGRQTA